MVKEKEVLQLIEEDIQEQVDLVIDQINNEIVTMEEDQIGFFREGLKKEIETYKEKELNELKLFAATQASQNKLKTKRDLLHMRQELVNQLFTAVRGKLMSFVESDEYVSYLERKLNEINVENNTGYFEVSEKDVDCFKDLLKKHHYSCDVQSSLIQIGGFNYVNSDSGYEVDYSLDTSLKNQIQWFQNNSGFTI